MYIHYINTCCVSVFTGACVRVFWIGNVPFSTLDVAQQGNGESHESPGLKKGTRPGKHTNMVVFFSGLMVT